MKHSLLLIAVIFCFSNVLSAQANETLITQTLIVEKNEKMEELLKKRDPQETINFLHNNINTINGQNKLENMISNQALFEDNVNTHNYNQHLVNNTYNPHYYAYRYPYAQGYSNVGYRSNNKWEEITKLRTKKRTIPGYKGVFEVSEMTISPLAESAVVDVEFKEQSLTYAPGYAPYYYQHANLNTHSKCKMHLGKMNDTVYLTRMYCNTSTNLPL